MKWCEATVNFKWTCSMHSFVSRGLRGTGDEQVKCISVVGGRSLLLSRISRFLFIVAQQCCSTKITGFPPLTLAEQRHILQRKPYCFSALPDLIVHHRAASSSSLDPVDVTEGHGPILRLKGHR